MAQKRYKSIQEEYNYSESKTPYQSQRYNNSSSAYDYALEEDEAPLKKVRKVRRVKRGTRQVFITRTDKSARPSAIMFIGVIIMTACLGMGVVSYSLVATQTSRNAKLRDELKVMKTRTAELSVEVTQSMDLVEIEHLARTRLEMSEPQLHQIVHISVPRENYTVYLSDTEDLTYAKAEISSNGFGALLNFFKKD